MKLAVVLVAMLGASCARERSHISVAAAASLRNAMPELVQQYRESSGVEVTVTYGASDVLAEQVKRGIRQEVLILAETTVLDELISRGTIAADSRRALATNSIMLVGPAGSTIRFATLAAMPDGAKIALGDPATAPVGRYAQTYLKSIGSWDALQSRMLFGGDVAGVLALAEQGKARVAIVYATDARRAAPLVVLDAPANAPTAEIVAGVVATSKRPTEARAFVEFVASKPGEAILARYGFGPAR